MGVDKYILTEAISAIMGSPVKLQSDCKNVDGATELQITDLIPFLLQETFKLQIEYLSYYMTDLMVTKVIKTARNKNASLRNQVFVIPDDFFDPAFDFDFTNLSESKSDSKCERGGEPYKRPYGWMRFALKVWDKFPDGNTWLGENGWRSSSSPGEWPVSYHGTGKKGAEGIIQSHFQAGPREAYGRGIYSTPDIKVANDYATSKKFISQKNGKTYKVIMQNRVNPEKRVIIEGKNFWLVRIPEGTSAEKEREIVESSIRPYGLLLKEV